jgi:N-acetylglucosaminyl-diphospho-decaprenol L-rhamnosyltransferase
MMPLPRLSIIIVSYNARQDLDRCLDTLVRHKPRIDHEIIVVDNSSTDGTVEMLRARWSGVRLIEAGSNLGFSKGNNLGIRQSFGELVLLLNGDTLVPAGAIDSLVAVLDSRPDVAIVGPRLVNGEGRAELSFGNMISPWNELRQKWRARGNVERLTWHEREVDWVSGACLLVRRADAEGVGLMDERYFMYTEDVDFCAASRARGRKVLFTPRVQIVHLRGRSRRSAPAVTEQAYRRSQIAFYEKHHPRWAPFLRFYLRIRRRSPDTDLSRT